MPLNSVRLVAEIGCNHQGSLQTAKRMIDALAEAGVMEAKGQKRCLDAHPEWKDRIYTSRHAFGRTYYEHRKALELSILQHRELRNYAEEKGVKYFLSVWDKESCEEAWNADFRTLKIPSACITDMELLETARVIPDSGGELILSTGMSTKEEVDEAVRVANPTMLLVCTSAYPVEPCHVHMERLLTLRQRYPGRRYGVSGHWTGIMLDCMAVGYGAEMIERHFTLDRTWKGTDHAASIEPEDARQWVKAIRGCEAARGWGGLRVIECELKARAKLRPALVKEEV